MSSFVAIDSRSIIVDFFENVQHFSEVSQGNSLIKSPLSTQRTQSSAIPVTSYEKVEASRFRILMTRIARIFTDRRAFALKKPQRAQRTQRKKQSSVLSEYSVVIESLFFPATRKAV